MQKTVNPSGLVVALLGFFLTRYTVTFALSDAPVPFLIGSVAPLVLGLSLSAFGVALAVGAFKGWYVRTIAVWTVLGAGSIGLFVLATIYGTDRSFLWGRRAVGAFSNILIGGGVGGALTGVYAAKNRAFQRELLNRQNRLVILNRLLHDKVMNAITVIKGTAPMLREEGPSGPGSVEAILEKARSVEKVMGSVRDLAEPGQDAELRSTDAAEAIEAALAQARERHPEATLVAQDLPSGPSVYANHRLVDVIYSIE